jgi:hypothetical protein
MNNKPSQPITGGKENYLELSEGKLYWRGYHTFPFIDHKNLNFSSGDLTKILEDKEKWVQN